MTFNEWLAANNFDPEAVAGSEKQKLTLQAAWRAEQAGDQKPQNSQAAATAGQHAVGVTVGGANGSSGVSFGRAAGHAPQGGNTFAATMEAIERENARREHIEQSAEKWCRENMGDRARCSQMKAMAMAAIGDEAMSEQKWAIEVMRWDRGAGPHIYSPAKAQVTDEVVEAAVCLAHGLPNADAAFDEKTLETAHKAFPRGISLKKLMMLGATANGYRGDDGDYSAVCRAAVGGRGDDGRGYGPMAVGISTGVQVPGILSNIANKYLASSFMNVEQAWRAFAKIRTVNDFKQVTTYRMSGNNTFLRVPPGGEIKHGALAETSYVNQAKTYGRLLGISREDYINDDLGAFVTVTNELGRGAADSINNIFWAKWLGDSNFFNTDKSKLNYDDGATDSVLSLAGLDNAEAIFGVQTKPDGTPLGATPKILLVPTGLKNTALTLMKSQDLVVGTTPASGPGANVFAGRYDVVSSVFLNRTTLNDENGVPQTVAGSGTAWYLLCDPMDIPCIEVCFLFGKDTPTVETDQFEFDRLGMATRAYFDFGVEFVEYRGGIKLKGAA